jgi:hypothetical protein
MSAIIYRFVILPDAELSKVSLGHKMHPRMFPPHWPAELIYSPGSFIGNCPRCGVSPSPLALSLHDVSYFSPAIEEFAGKDRWFWVNFTQNEVSVYADKSIETLDKRRFSGNGLLP